MKILKRNGIEKYEAASGKCLVQIVPKEIYNSVCQPKLALGRKKVSRMVYVPFWLEN